LDTRRSIEAARTIGFVAIGRNEGERLRSCLKAIKSLHPNSPVVYVDSGSTDASVEFAQSLGIPVVQLDQNTPFTAARGRNAGAETLISQYPDLEYIQFLDGDCELLKDWIEAGLSALSADDVGIVSGRRSELYPHASIYNYLMDKEWNTEPGEVLGVPGDMLVKVQLYRDLGGFRAELIAGEDFDFCLRAKYLGYSTLRVDAMMSMHDANILSFSQWYKRVRRGGHAWANLRSLHQTPEGRTFQQKIISILVWAALYPALLLGCLIVYPYALVPLVLLQLGMVVRCAIRERGRGEPTSKAMAYASLVYLAKYAELQGLVEYWSIRLKRGTHTLIEYK